MSDETEEKAADAPVAKKYVVAIERADHPDAPSFVLSHAATGWGGNKGDVLPDNVVAALTANIAHVGHPISTLQQWLSIGWIKEA